MQFHDKLWNFKKEDKKAIKEFTDELGVSKVTARLLLNRGIKSADTARIFLNPKIDYLYDPFLLKDIDIAVKRIGKGIHKCESVWIYGSDYIDGITSVSILYIFFRSINYKVNYYIHDDFQEKCAISYNSIDYIKSLGGDLIICVDCQINSDGVVEYANSKGIDLIIIDNQEHEKTITQATAVINPKNENCTYPYKMLACVGIAFKLIQGLTPKEMFLSQCSNYLDITAFGTIADKAPVTGENRILVKNGLNELSHTNNIGMKAYLEVYGLSNKSLVIADINKIIKPLFTPDGKVRMASSFVSLLLSENYEEAINISRKLNNNKLIYNIDKLQNKKDKLIERNMDSDAGRLFTSIEFCKTPILEIDMELDIKDIGFNLIEEISMLAPYGLGNPKPVFAYKRITVESADYTGKDKRDLMLLVQDENRVFDCIGLDYANENITFLKKEKVDIAFNLELSVFKDIETIQFKINDLRRRSKYYYEETRLIQDYYLTFAEKVSELEYVSKEYTKENFIDLRNFKDRAKYVFQNLESGNSNLILINTAEALIDLYLFLSDNNSFDILNCISFKTLESNKKNVNSIVVNPSLKDLDFDSYENIYVYDIPFLEEEMNILAGSNKKIHLLYNRSDCSALLRFLDSSIPNRNDLAKVYKYFKRLPIMNQILYEDIIKAMQNINFTKLRFCLDILSEAGLLYFSQYGQRLNIELLPPPKNKIDITATKLYRNMNLFKDRFRNYIKTAFDII